MSRGGSVVKLSSLLSSEAGSSISLHVTRNRRLTFQIENDEIIGRQTSRTTTEREKRPCLCLIRFTPAIYQDGNLRIEKAFGVNMDTLMRMQGAYRIAQARKDAGKIRVRRYQPAAAHA